jgi:uncharacterized RDD family membrane protein YckC
MISAFHWTSAAQNTPVIRICSKCGALLLDDAESCSFCEVEAAQRGQARKIAESVAVADRPHEGLPASEAEPEPEWRMEVSRRLELYRARHGYIREDAPQTGLPFLQQHAAAAEPEIHEELELTAPEPPRPRTAQRTSRGAERVDICIQPELNFASSPEDRARPQTALVPVAALADRRWAGALDAIFLALTCAGFVGLFHSLGGQLTLEKTDAIVYLTAAYLFYAVYFSLFIVMAGSTPGMQLMNLSVVRLDGSLPDTRQLLWRNFGYLLSGATLLLGFVWSVWDEDRFTWHDRMSQTYITSAAPLADIEPLEVPVRRRQFAHK